MPDNLEPQLRELLNQLQQIIRNTAQEVVDERNAGFVAQNQQVQGELHQLRQQLGELPGLASRLDGFVQKLDSHQNNLTQVQEHAQQELSKLHDLHNLARQEFIQFHGTMEQKTQERQSLFEQHQISHNEHVQTTRQHLSNQQSQLADLQLKIDDLTTKVQNPEVLKGLQSQLEKIQQSLLQSQSKGEQTASAVTVLGKIMDEAASHIKGLQGQMNKTTEQFADLRGVWETAAIDFNKKFLAEQQRSEALERQLQEAGEHINILNEQILSQAKLISEFEERRGRLLSRLDDLERKYNALLAQPEPPGLIQRWTGWLSGS